MSLTTDAAITLQDVEDEKKKQTFDGMLPPEVVAALSVQDLLEKEIIRIFMSTRWSNRGCPELDQLKDIAVLGHLGSIYDPNQIYVNQTNRTPQRTEPTFNVRQPCLDMQPPVCIRIYAMDCSIPTRPPSDYRSNLTEPAFILYRADPTHGSLDDFKLTGKGEGAEEMVLRAVALPDYDGSVSPQDAEGLLLSLCAKYMRIPMLLRFLAGGRLGALSHPDV